LSSCKYPVEVNQIELHPLLQQAKMLEYCKKHNIIVTAYSPLGTKNRQMSSEMAKVPDFLNNPSILEMAKKRNATPAQIVLAWGIIRGTVVIPKSVHFERITENLKATEIGLSDAEMNIINAMDKHFRFISGKIWTVPGSPYTLEGLWNE
jgi:alcohol dehydrogenase (NADP+)